VISKEFRLLTKRDIIREGDWVVSTATNRWIKIGKHYQFIGKSAHHGGGKRTYKRLRRVGNGDITWPRWLVCRNVEQKSSCMVDINLFKSESAAYKFKKNFESGKK